MSNEIVVFFLGDDRKDAQCTSVELWTRIRKHDVLGFSLKSGINAWNYPKPLSNQILLISSTDLLGLCHFPRHFSIDLGNMLQPQYALS